MYKLVMSFSKIRQKSAVDAYGVSFCLLCIALIYSASNNAFDLLEIDNDASGSRLATAPAGKLT